MRCLLTPVRRYWRGAFRIGDRSCISLFSHTHTHSRRAPSHSLCAVRPPPLSPRPQTLLPLTLFSLLVQCAPVKSQLCGLAAGLSALSSKLASPLQAGATKRGNPVFDAIKEAHKLPEMYKARVSASRPFLSLTLVLYTPVMSPVRICSCVYVPFHGVHIACTPLVFLLFFFARARMCVCV